MNKKLYNAKVYTNTSWDVWVEADNMEEAERLLWMGQYYHREVGHEEDVVAVNEVTEIPEDDPTPPPTI